MIKIFKEDVDITQDVRETLYSNVRNIGVKVEVANKLTLTGLEIIQCDVEQQILTEDKFNLGTANCATCELVINNIDEPYDPKFFIGQEIKVYYTLTTAKGDYVEIPMGIFIVDTAIRNTNKIKINAYDRVLLTEENYNTKTTLEYPTTLKEIAKDACEISKVYFSDADFFNSDLVYTDMVVFGADTTCRNVLQNVAEMACGYLKSNRDGMLYIHSLDTNTIVDTIYPKNYFKLDQLEQQFGPLKSVYMIYDEDDALYGEGSPQLQIRNNYYIPKKFEHLPKKMFDYIGHINYCPATLEWQGNPLLDAGDFINVIDKKGNTNKLLITSQKFSYNGGLKCTLKSVGKSDVALATEKKNVISEAIEGLNRRLNALKTKIDKAELDMLMTQIDEFSGRLDGLIKEFKEVQINVTPDGIVNTVTNSKTYQDYLDGIYDGLNGLQGQVVTMESVISQHADQINMSVKGDNIISYINLDKSGVQIRGDKIQLQGVVTFEDLSGDGKTVINGSNITTGSITGDIIKGGTIEGINIKGENVDVTAKLSISPEELPETQDFINYPKPSNSSEWATIDFNVLSTNEKGTPNIIDTVKLKTFPYGEENIWGDTNNLPYDKRLWKYGLEIDGAIKATDNVYISGRDGLVVSGEQGVTAKIVKTDEIRSLAWANNNGEYKHVLEIKDLNAMYPRVYSHTQSILTDDNPYIFFDCTSDGDKIQTNIRSTGGTFIESLEPNKSHDLIVNNIKINSTNNTDHDISNDNISGLLRIETSKLYGRNFEFLAPYKPYGKALYSNVHAQNFVASGRYRKFYNSSPEYNIMSGTFALPIKIKNNSDEFVNVCNADGFASNVTTAEPIFCSDPSWSGLNPVHSYVSGGTETTGSGTVTLNGGSYYYSTIKLSNLVKTDNLDTAEKFAVIVSANTPGAQVWWDTSFKHSYGIRIVSNKPNTNFSYIVYSRTVETEWVDLDQN